MKRWLHIPVAFTVGALLATHLIETSREVTVVIAPRAAEIKTDLKEARQLAQQQDAKQLARISLSKKQFRCFDWIMTRESHWNPKAKNPTSSAEGIGQLLDSTHRNIAIERSKDPRAQVVAALAYIARRYGPGGACSAKRHWKENNWY